LYAGGFFTTAGDSPASYVAQWDGSSWTDVGFGVSGGYYFPGVWALAASGNNLFVGGIFEMAGDTAVNNIAQWDGSSWSVLDSGMSGDANGDAVYALAVSDSTLFAGGLFSTAGDSAASNIAQWSGSSWTEVGFGGSVESYVYALAASGSNVYVGGYFTTAGGTTANNIAMWNGSSWSALGWGIDGSVYSQVYALAVSGSNLYVGGGFDTAGGIAANNIAKWDGSSWSALGSGMLGEGIDGLGPTVSALAVSGGTLYAGGDFSTAGGVSARNIAQWNGSSWSALGSGIGIGGVGALAVSGGTLYAGGGFTTAGGNSANNIAQWNGSSWSALGSGISGAGSDGEGPSVDALAVSGSTLYAGGDFSTAGGNPAANIAKWDGNSWSALGSGMNDDVYALAVSGSDLCAGGGFTTAGGITANYIAKWDGSTWSALGSGVNSTVSALAVSGAGSDLYAGGQFTTAGGKLSYYLARAILRLPSLTLRQTNSSAVAVSWPSPSPGFVLQQNTYGLDSGNWSNVTDSMLDDGTNKMITQPMGTNRFFRLVLP
jgi:hypothetical protein